MAYQFGILCGASRSTHTGTRMSAGSSTNTSAGLQVLGRVHNIALVSILDFQNIRKIIQVQTHEAEYEYRGN